jgi:hypothetical protein
LPELLPELPDYFLTIAGFFLLKTRVSTGLLPDRVGIAGFFHCILL